MISTWEMSEWGSSIYSKHMTCGVDAIGKCLNHVPAVHTGHSCSSPSWLESVHRCTVAPTSETAAQVCTSQDPSSRPGPDLAVPTQTDDFTTSPQVLVPERGGVSAWLPLLTLYFLWDLFSDGASMALCTFFLHLLAASPPASVPFPRC